MKVSKCVQLRNKKIVAKSTLLLNLEYNLYLRPKFERYQNKLVSCQALSHCRFGMTRLSPHTVASIPDILQELCYLHILQTARNTQKVVSDLV